MNSVFLKKILPLLISIFFINNALSVEKIFFENDLFQAKIFLTNIESDFTNSKVYVSFNITLDSKRKINFYSQFLEINCSTNNHRLIEDLLSTKEYGKGKIIKHSNIYDEYRSLVKSSYKKLFSEVCI